MKQAAVSGPGASLAIESNSPSSRLPSKTRAPAIPAAAQASVAVAICNAVGKGCFQRPRARRTGSPALEVLAFIMGDDLPAGIRWLWAHDSMRRGGGKGKTGWKPSVARFLVSNGTFQKISFKTISYRESSITSACYLCNTLRKRRGVSLFEVVPLLRVQNSSVIVMLRRRGASRGRPVRWFA